MLHSFVDALEVMPPEGVDPAFIVLPEPDEVTSATDWAQETVALLEDRGLCGDTDATTVTHDLVELLAEPVSAGYLVRILFVTGPVTSWLVYHFGAWPAVGEADQVLPAAIGFEPDPHLGVETETIDMGDRRLHERFHLVAAEPAQEHSGERPVVLVGGMSTRLTDPRLPLELDVALVTATADLATLMASIPTLSLFLSSDEVVDLLIE